MKPFLVDESESRDGDQKTLPKKKPVSVFVSFPHGELRQVSPVEVSVSRPVSILSHPGSMFRYCDSVGTRRKVP